MRPILFSDRLPRHALRLGAGPRERGAVRVPLARLAGQRPRLPAGGGDVPHARLRPRPRRHLRPARRALRLHRLLRVHPEDGHGEVSQKPLMPIVRMTIFGLILYHHQD